MDFSPSPCRPRRPTGAARQSGCLPPMRGLCLAPQRHLCPRAGRLGQTASATLAVQGLFGQCLAPVAHQRPQAFRELVTAMYVHSVSFRGLVRLLDLLGCGVGAATLWRDVQAVAPGRAPDPQAKLPSWVEVDETWLSLGGEKRPVAVVLGPKGARLDLRLSSSGFDWGGWFTDLAARGVQGLTTDDDPVYGPALETAGLDRQKCAVARRTCHKVDPYLTFNTVTGPGPATDPATPGPGATTGGGARPVGALGSGDAGPRAPAARGAQAAVAPRGTLARAGAQPGEPQGARLHQPAGGWFGRFKPRARLTRGLKTEAGALNFVRLMARSMA